MGSKLILSLVLILVISLGVGCSAYSKSEVMKVNCCDGSVAEFSLAEYSYSAEDEGIYLIDRTTGEQHYFSYNEFYDVEW